MYVYLESKVIHCAQNSSLFVWREPTTNLTAIVDNLFRSLLVYQYVPDNLFVILQSEISHYEESRALSAVGQTVVGVTICKY